MKKSKLSTVLKSGIMLIACLVFITGCSSKTNVENKAENKNDTSGDKKIHIVATFYPIYEFTKNIAGDAATVDLLIPTDIEPHDWELSPKDMANIQKADLFVYNSQFMETWVSKVEDSLGKDKKTIFVEASEGIELANITAEHDHDGTSEDHDHDHDGTAEDHDHDHDGTAEDHDHDAAEGHHHDHGGMDPHVWLSPVLAQKEVENITAALVEKDPKNKDVYEKNSKVYLQQLKDLDQAYRGGLKEFKGKEMIVQHAAFGYMAKEYGLNQIPIAGLSPDQEPSPARMAEIKKFAQEHQLHTIYFEELASPKVAETLAREIGAKTKVLSTLEGLSKEDKDKGLGYIDVMKNNLKTLEETLSK